MEASTIILVVLVILYNTDRWVSFFFSPLDRKHSSLHKTAKQSIQDAWSRTDHTTVPLDLLIEYRTYLVTPRWRTLRQLVLHRDGNRCIRCHSLHHLQVHHTHYRGIYEDMDFTPSQLVTLCTICHDLTHKEMLEK